MVHLNILLQKKHQNSEGIARVREILGDLGLTPVQSGKATVSCRISKVDFINFFGELPEKTEPKKVDSFDFGSKGGYIHEEELDVPVELKDYVQSITVSPPHTYL